MTLTVEVKCKSESRDADGVGFQCQRVGGTIVYRNFVHLHSHAMPLFTAPHFCWMVNHKSNKSQHTTVFKPWILSAEQSVPGDPESA